jgi:hypothetical protein
MGTIAPAGKGGALASRARALDAVHNLDLVR